MSDFRAHLQYIPMTRWLELAHRLGVTRGRHTSVLVGALAVRGGALLGQEANFTRRAFPTLHRGHAEERLLKRLGENAHGCTLYVVRDNRRMSRPCAHCWALLLKYEVRRVVYLNAAGMPTSERVK